MPKGFILPKIYQNLIMFDDFDNRFYRSTELIVVFSKQHYDETLFGIKTRLDTWLPQLRVGG